MLKITDVPSGQTAYEKDQTTPESLAIWDKLLMCIYTGKLGGYSVYNEKNEKFQCYVNGVAYYR